MVNIGVTTYNRKDFLCRCVDSILQNTTIQYQLFIYDDASTDGSIDMLKKRYKNSGIHLIEGKKRNGIVHGFNALWEVSENYNDNKYFCYIQDDVVVKYRWLEILISVYGAQQHASDYKIGLFSGHHAPEHPTVDRKIINIDGSAVLVYIKPSMRATNMIATYGFWGEIGKIPALNPNGQPRGFPGPPKSDGSRGLGSNMDVYITGFQSNGVFVHGAAGKNCSWNLGTYCLVVPGLVKHEATTADSSTWGNPNKEK